MNRPISPAISLRGGVAGLAAATLLLTPFVAATPAAAAPDGSDLVINEVYARGGSTNQPYTHKFIELYNPTDEEISLDGRSLQYRAAPGTAASTTTLALTGCVGPGGYFLVQGGTNGDNGAALPTPDASVSMNLQGSNGTVALVDTATAITLPTGDVTVSGDSRIVDLVGYGTSNTWEGAVGTATTSGTNSVPQAITRTGGVDTDDNRADFSITATPTPQNSEGYECEDGDGNTDPDPDPQTLTIAEIQGTGETTPYNGQTVITRGVVTGVYPDGGFNGAFIQTEGTGGDLQGHNASHGIFVFGGSSGLASGVQIGDFVEVTGTASEYFGLTQISATTWTTLTEAAEPVVPAAIELPGLAGREVFEGMLIAPQGDFTVNDTYNTNRFGWVGLAAGDTPEAAHRRHPAAGSGRRRIRRLRRCQRRSRDQDGRRLELRLDQLQLRRPHHPGRLPGPGEPAARGRTRLVRPSGHSRLPAHGRQPGLHLDLPTTHPSHWPQRRRVAAHQLGEDPALRRGC